MSSPQWWWRPSLVVVVGVTSSPDWIINEARGRRVEVDVAADDTNILWWPSVSWRAPSTKKTTKVEEEDWDPSTYSTQRAFLAPTDDGPRQPSHRVSSAPLGKRMWKRHVYPLLVVPDLSWLPFHVEVAEWDRENKVVKMIAATKKGEEVVLLLALV